MKIVLTTVFLLAMGGFKTGAFADNLLDPINTLNFPIRIAEGSDARLYVTDSKTDSIFILKNLLTEAELKE